MKKCISLATWVDMTDLHEYRDGDPFPFDGRNIPDDRIDELSTAMNQTGAPLISVEEVEEPKKKPK